jgi:RNA polymerase sporulation-specific sigma factor
MDKLPALEEERAIIERARASKQGMAELIEKYTVLVHVNANKWRSKRRVDDSWKLDLYQDGFIGLMRAVDTFNTDYDTSFATWALICIEGQLRNTIRDIKGHHLEHATAVSLNSMLNDEMTIEGLFASESTEPDFSPSLSDVGEDANLEKMVSKRELDLIRVRYNLEI